MWRHSWPGDSFPIVAAPGAACRVSDRVKHRQHRCPVDPTHRGSQLILRLLPRRPGGGKPPAARGCEPDATLARVRSGAHSDPPLLHQQFQVPGQRGLVEIEAMAHHGLSALAHLIEHGEQGKLRAFDPVRSEPAVVQLRHGSGRPANRRARADELLDVAGPGQAGWWRPPHGLSIVLSRAAGSGRHQGA